MAGEQAQLLDTETKELNAYWVDPAQPLLVPVNPLHYAAHKYQIILQRLDVQASKNPAQFNSGNYIAIMEKLEKLWEAINNGEKTIAVHDKPGVADPSGQEDTSALGDRTALGLDSGVSADNPFAGKRSDSVRAVAVPADVS
jgi:hypothetical protein